MKHPRVCLAFSLALSICAPILASAAIITTAVNPANGHTYHLITTATWTACEAEAVSLSGHLVAINDAAENAWVENTFKPFGSSFWIGYTDAASEGTWYWINGEPTTYSNWGGIEPNDYCPAMGGEDTAIMITNGYGVGIGILDAQWVDIPDNYFCYVPGAPLPMGIVEVPTATDVGDAPSIKSLEVLANHPNPFANGTTLSIGLAEASDAEIDVYDVAGRRVASRQVSLAAGWNHIEFNGLDDQGHSLPSGVYLYRVRANGHTVTSKMLIAH